MVPRQFFSYFAGGLQFFSVAFSRNFKYIVGSSAQVQSIGTLLGQIGLRGGSCDMSKSQRLMRSGADRGVSQANGAAIHPKFTELCQHEIVSGILKK